MADYRSRAALTEPGSTRLPSLVEAAVVAVLALGGGMAASTMIDATITQFLGPGTPAGTLLPVAASFVGMALVGLGYLLLTGRGTAYVRLSRPSRLVVLAVLMGVVAWGILYLVLDHVVVAEVEMAESWVGLVIGEDVHVAVGFLLVVFVFNAPAEEFVFRGLIQRRLREAFGVEAAVALASLLFAVLHVPRYLVMGSFGQAAVLLIAAFGSGFLFGVTYVYSKNLIVPILVHACYNAVQISASLVL